MKLFSLFERALSQHTTATRQIVLALSGGLDSRVMLDLLASYRDLHPKHNYLVIHVHHGLSENADHWLSLCEKWSVELGFIFNGIKVQVKNTGQGVEHAAREARYEVIAKAVEQNALILTAHHADDQAETFLLALKRGSGVAGLAAMPEIRKLKHAELLRPFLGLYRDEIENYARQRNLEWVEDESNADSRFDRNFIRHHWLAAAQERWPSIVKAINRSAGFCAEQESLLDELLQEHDRKVQQSDGGLLIKALEQYTAKMQVALLRRWLKQQAGLSPPVAQIQQIFNTIINAAWDADPIMQFAHLQLRRYKKILYLLPKLIDVSDWQHTLAPKQPLFLPDGIGRIELSEYQGLLGLGMLKPEPEIRVSVSFDPQGLMAHPIGRQGQRKLKKLFQEYAVPTWQRKRIPLIFYGHELAAVGDLFVCQGFEGQDCELIWHKK